MEKIKNFLFLNGLLNGYPIQEILSMADISCEEAATQILGCSVEDFPTVVEKIDSANKVLEATDLVKIFLNFYRTSHYSFAYAGNGNLLQIEKFREIVTENPKTDMQIIANVLQCTFNKICHSSECKLMDGVLYCSLEDEPKIAQSMMEAFALYFNGNGILKPIQLKNLRKCISARRMLKTLSTDSLSRIITACLKKGYHPCVLAQTCVEVCDYLPLYAETGIVAERVGTNSTDIVMLLPVMGQDSYIPYVLKESAFVQTLNGDLRGASKLCFDGNMAVRVGA